MADSAAGSGSGTTASPPTRIQVMFRRKANNRCQLLTARQHGLRASFTGIQDFLC